MPAAAPVLHDALGRPVRLTGWPDSGGAGATQRLSDRRETPLWRGPTGLSRKPAGAPRRGTCRAYCRAYVLRPANQLRSYYWSYNRLAAISMSWQNPARTQVNAVAISPLGCAIPRIDTRRTHSVSTCSHHRGRVFDLNQFRDLCAFNN